ncbi:ATP-dependent DNA helicase RecG [Clostridia bacterium]|nr:ATP-dependent DNA helicase RecG [Clostridia bacterium]
MLNVSDKVKKLENVGEKRQKLYAKLGIHTIDDLIWHLPRNYIDFNAPLKIGEVRDEGTFAINGKVIKRQSTLKKRLLIYTITITDGEDLMDVKVFNAKYVYQALVLGEEFLFWGKITRAYGILQMQLKSFVKFETDLTMQPLYNLTAGLNSRMVAATIKDALQQLPHFQDLISQKTKEEMNLVTLEYAFQNIHFPKNKEALIAAKKRLALDELVNFSLNILKLTDKRKIPSQVQIENVDLAPLYEAVGFEPTNAQKRAIDEIISNMQEKKVMRRLIQGDVGCGKTLVAIAGIYIACKNGYQAAIMAPTEILATQHHGNIKKLFESLGIKVEILSGYLTKAKKTQIREQIRTSEVDCAVGTCALISDLVEFKNLGLVVVDEQHKFGVAQRQKLGAKGPNPHIMIMSATPIPRTLAMMAYNGLDISIIDEMPPGRKPAKTCFVDSSYRDRIYNFIKRELKNNRQCYIVCPLIEAEDENDLEDESVESLKSVIKHTKELQEGPFADYKIGFIHGKLKQKEKEQIMQDFKEKQTQILVSTTVIEVGIDVPNATVILIENAEKFGLAQLHQLRGRIGRSDLQSYCILLSDSGIPAVKKRLEFVAKHTNGFEIAEFDLEIRGPGDFFGTKQYGTFSFKLADCHNANLLIKAQEIAKEIFESSKF